MGQTHRKTTIIVGAGASHEFGLPTGAELKGIISRKLNIQYNRQKQRYVSGDKDIINAFKTAKDYNTEYDKGEVVFKKQGWLIRDNMQLAPSIDNFLHTHHDNKELVLAGKLAIAKSILEAERNSILFQTLNKSTGRHHPFNEKVSKTWLNKFFMILVAGKNSFPHFLDTIRNLTFISFNYDRCIHQFFYVATKQYFNLEDDEANEVLEALNILYPYGAIGPYLWQYNKSNFGETNEYGRLYNSAIGIRTFTEGRTSEVESAISESIHKAENIIFMGFGFLGLNMEYLFQNNTYKPKMILATAYGLSENSINFNKEKFIDLFFNGERRNPVVVEENLKILDMTCSELMHEFNAYLSG